MARIFPVRACAVLVAGLVGAGALAVAPSASAHEGHGHVLLYTEAPAGPWHDAAIAEGAPKVKTALEAEGMTVDLDADSSEFTDEGLAKYDAIVAFQINGDPWTAEEKGALERWTAAGGGIAAVHNALDMRGNYPWWDTMVGSLMPGHAATGTDPGPQGVVRVEDDVHPSTAHLTGSSRWTRNDEWYNFSNNVRGTAHVLATMDETTYAPGSNAMGYDHPISWCKPYEGGRFWGTAMGHFPSHYDEPAFMQHLVGGVKYVAGLEQGDCGGTVWDSFEKVSLDENTSAPFAMDIAEDGRVFYTELVRGEIRVWDPRTQGVTTALTQDVYSGGEDGMLGIALHPDFSENGHVFVYMSPDAADNADPASFKSQIARFTMDETGVFDPDSKKVIIEVPARRLPDEPGHTGGGLDFDAQGNLYLGVGDDVNPHSEPSGGYAPLSTRPGTFHDARETSANTNDLRGKLLRITPLADPTGPGLGTGYTVPAGNLFPEADDAGRDKTLPEIYAMGFRNPFRFSVDQETGAIGLADYSPDNNNDAPDTRGPAGIAEWNLIKSPGNYGWPLCMGNNEPFRDVDYTTSPVTVGGYFDCANPVNDSPRNTGLTDLPPARAADMFYGYRRSSVPGVIPQGGGLAPMGGPTYQFDAALDSDTRFPASYDGKPFFYDWARNKMYSIQLRKPAAAAGSQVEKVNPFLPQEQFLAPIDSKFGPDGSLYVLDWGGGYGRDNPSSGLHRIDYISGSRSPAADIEVDKDSGPAPLTVAFDGSGSTDPEGATLTYAWDFDGDGTTDAETAEGSFTYDVAGTYDARLTVTDPTGKDGTTTVPITVGNTRPEVEFNLPPHGSFFDFGDDISWDVSVTDAEDGTVSGDDVIIQPALGHDEHAHPTTPLSGLTGTTSTTLGGHAPDENIFFAIDARYTDQGGEGGTDPLTGSETSLVFPKVKQAEFFDSRSDDMTVSASRDIEGVDNDKVISGPAGAWAHYDPVNFHRIDELALRVSANQAGSIELRRGAVDGELLATAEVPATGSTRFTDVMVDVSGFPAGTMDLHLVFRGTEIKLNFLEAIGQGSSPTTRPEVSITAPTAGTQLEPGADVTVEATASDSGSDVSSVELFVDGASIGTDTSAPYTATWTAPAEGLYELTAVATNADGKTRTSRIVQAQVGELFGTLQPFTNAGGEFERIGAGAFRITGAGANTWQSVDQYSTLYQPGGGDDTTWEATVKVTRQTHANGSAKSGIIVRNDMTLPGSSPGYAMVGIRPSNGVEFLTDPDGNGQLNQSFAGGTTSYPTWVRLKRDGASYSAWFSKNGTTWTQVGTPVTLAGAAPTQDVGFFTVAHSGTPGSVDYEGFGIDSDPVVEDPEQTYPALSCQSPLSDEFTTGLNGKWSVRQATGSAVRTQGGSLLLPVTSSDINEATPGPISFVGQPAPEGAWEVSTKLTLQHATHWQYAGLLVHRSDNEYNKLAFVRHQNGNRFLEFQTETNGARTTHASFTVPADFPATAYLKLVSNGTQLTAHWSTNGEAWTQLAGTAPLKTGAQVGLVAAGDTGTAPTTASVDWFRVTPDREAPAFTADDEFDGTALDGCRWAQTVRYDAEHVSVGDGHLKVETQPGDINGNNPLNPRNFVLQEAPEGDFVATTRFKAPLEQRYQLAGLLMYGDDDNYVKSDVVAYNAPGTPLDLRAELAGEANGTGIGSRNLDIANSSESGYWYLRVTRTGTSYTAEVSDGGVSWQPIGAAIDFAKPLTGLGLMAIGPEQDEPVTVEFDYFHLEGDEEPPADTTAPVTTATWSPAAPDGRDGWYVTAPSLTLEATDEDAGVAATEYRIDAGTWTAYTGPVTLTGDGRHQVEYRSTDEAGNIETVHVVEVSVDTVDPAGTVTGVTDGETYGDSDRPTLDWSATDDGSGVAGVTATLDGAAIERGALELWRLPLGEHTLAVTATDRAGNTATTSVVFATDTSVDDLRGLVTRFADDGSIGAKLERRLLQRLSLTARWIQQGQDAKAVKELQGFGRDAEEVRDDAVRATLQRDASWLIERLG